MCLAQLPGKHSGILQKTRHLNKAELPRQIVNALEELQSAGSSNWTMTPSWGNRGISAWICTSVLQHVAKLSSRPFEGLVFLEDENDAGRDDPASGLFLQVTLLPLPCWQRPIEKGHLPICLAVSGVSC